MRIRLPALIALLLIFGMAGAVSAQEALGAGRMELSLAPGGGTLFTKPAKTTDIDFSNYALGGGFVYNLNRLFAVEGELGGGLGLRHTFATTTTVPIRTLTPRTLAYEGNIVYNPNGNDHALVPYVTTGLGGLTMFTRPALKDLGLDRNGTFFTGNGGAGLKWFVAPGWGLRADYRLLVIKSKKDAPAFFGLNETRYGHRIYGSLVYTFGK